MMFICLATSSDIILDLVYIIPIVFCDVKYAITQNMTYWILKNLSYNILLGVDWLKSTKTVINWVV